MVVYLLLIYNLRNHNQKVDIPYSEILSTPPIIGGLCVSTMIIKLTLTHIYMSILKILKVPEQFYLDIDTKIQSAQ
jgi:hypothetical protein